MKKLSKVFISLILLASLAWPRTGSAGCLQSTNGHTSDTGSACASGTGGGWWAPIAGGGVTNLSAFTAGQLYLICYAPISFPVSITNLAYYVQTQDNSGNLYDICLYTINAGSLDNSGNPIASLSTGGTGITGTTLGNAMNHRSVTQTTPVLIAPGRNICIGMTGNAGTAKLTTSSTGLETGQILFSNTNYTSTSPQPTTNGACPQLTAVPSPLASTAASSVTPRATLPMAEREIGRRFVLVRSLAFRGTLVPRSVNSNAEVTEISLATRSMVYFSSPMACSNLWRRNVPVSAEPAEPCRGEAT